MSKLHLLRPMGTWAMRGILIAWGIAAPVVVTLITVHVTKPTIHLRFEPVYPMRIIAQQRPEYGSEAISLEINTDVTLKDSIVRLLALSKNPDFSAPMNGFVEPRFGWPAGETSFFSRTIGAQDYVIIATIKKAADRSHATFFFNEFYGALGPENKPIVELEALRDLEPGTYYMKIALLSESAAPAIETFKIVWDGNSFAMSATK